MKKLPTGTVVVRKDGTRTTKRVKQEDGTWKWLPNGNERFGGDEGRKRAAETRRMKNTGNSEPKPPKRLSPSRNPIHKPRPAAITTKNPDKVKIKPLPDGRWVRRDSRTFVFIPTTVEKRANVF